MKTLKAFFIVIAIVASTASVYAQASANSSLNTVLKHYYGLKDALVSSNTNAANTHAKELLTSIQAVNADQLPASQKSVWSKYTNKLQFDARHISESNSLDHQREHFTSLSKNMYDLVKSSRFNTESVYEQYCPMKKATWLSETATIKNPYYGSQMMDCGKTTETLAPAAH